MIIPIPTGESIRATLTGHAMREVKCEKCGGEYVYFVSASASGSGLNVLYLDGDGARQRAQEAKARLQKELRGKYYAVPCPDCGWYQKYMVQILQFKRLGILSLIAALPLIWLGVLWVFTPNEEPADLNVAIWVGLSAGLAFAAAVIHWRWDDNANPKARLLPDSKNGGLAMRKADFEKQLANTVQA